MCVDHDDINKHSVYVTSKFLEPKWNGWILRLSFCLERNVKFDFVILHIVEKFE